MNSRTWQLLRLLADGGFHSGEELGRQLGLSRATVFAALKDVADSGVMLQRIRGRGYRLAEPWHPIDAEEVRDLLGDTASRLQIDVLQQAGSSNTELMRRATQGAVSGSVLAVELQTSGRGRIGRSWHSGLGNALTFSLLWRFDCGLNRLSGLSLAVGLAVARALKRLDAAGVGLKWPNDILTQEGKLGGVLIEAQGDMYGPSTVVIGIGLNCSLPQKLAQIVTQRASALDQICRAVPARNPLLAALLKELVIVLDAFAVEGFASMRAEWEQNHAHQDAPVVLQMPDGSRIGGVARGVSDGGELRLETEQGMRELGAGEVGVCA